MSGMGAHPAGADLVTRLSKRCREYEDRHADDQQTIADLRRQLEELQNR